jgi:hypothetical protein
MKAFVAAMAAVALMAVPAFAHRGRSTLSVIEIDATTGTVVVTHRMAAHDVEPALVKIAPEAQPSVDDPYAMEALIAYAARAFILSDGSGPVELKHRGTDLAGDDIRLTYVGRLAPPASSVIVDSNLFEESHPDQENQVNVRRSKVTRTAVFRVGSAPQSITFD